MCMTDWSCMYREQYHNTLPEERSTEENLQFNKESELLANSLHNPAISLRTYGVHSGLSAVHGAYS